MSEKEIQELKSGKIQFEALDAEYFIDLEDVEDEFEEFEDWNILRVLNENICSLNVRSENLKLFIADNLPIVIELFRLCHYSGVAEAYPLEERYDTADLGYIETEDDYEQGLVYKTSENTDPDEYKESFSNSKVKEFVEGEMSSLRKTFDFFTVLLEQKRSLDVVEKTLREKSAIFEDHYGTATPVEYEELQESLEELEKQRDELEEEIEEAEDDEKSELKEEAEEVEDDEKSELKEKLKEIEYKIKAVEDQIESFNLDEGDPDSDLYTEANDFVDEYLDPTDFEAPVGWRLDSIYENISIQQKLVEKFTQNFEKAFGSIYKVQEALDLTDSNLDELLALIETNEQSSWKLKEITDNHLESNYNFDSLMIYLKKTEKKTLLNI